MGYTWTVSPKTKKTFDLDTLSLAALSELAETYGSQASAVREALIRLHGEETKQARVESIIVDYGVTEDELSEAQAWVDAIEW